MDLRQNNGDLEDIATFRNQFILYRGGGRGENGDLLSRILNLLQIIYILSDSSMSRPLLKTRKASDSILGYPSISLLKVTANCGKTTVSLSIPRTSEKTEK
jgi:hypothetical protein